jgi:hypothetical protein
LCLSANVIPLKTDELFPFYHLNRNLTKDTVSGEAPVEDESLDNMPVGQPQGKW